MPSLVHCIYTSRATHLLTPGEIDQLLAHSRDNNTRHGITGVLLYVDGYFMQVLEGDSSRIEELYAKILEDPRHTQITCIISEAISHRFFGDWTMGLSTLGHKDLARILGAEDSPAREALLASVDEGRAKKLLRAFAEGRWRQSLRFQAASAGMNSAGA